MGVTMHEEQLKRWRRPGRIWDAHGKRIPKKLLKVTRYAAMEQGLRQAGFSETDIKRMIGELMAAYKISDEAAAARGGRAYRPLVPHQRDSESRPPVIQRKILRNFLAVFDKGEGPELPTGIQHLRHF
jgi:hypothetical protein